MKVRMQITKDPEIRFVSHLDYLRALERSVRRAGLPAAYSEGFNPHMKLSLASALGVGVVSRAEFVELELTEPLTAESAVALLRPCLPRGIRITGADVADSLEPALMSQTALAEYAVSVRVPEDFSGLVQRVETFNSSGSVVYRKAAPKRKAGFKEVDVKRFVQQVSYSLAGDRLTFSFQVAIFGDGSLKATDVLQVLGVDAADADVTRLGLYRAGGRPMLGTL